MKRRYFICFIIAIWAFAGCQKEDLLEKYPLTAVSPDLYFTNGNDFKLYVNQFYNDLGSFGGWGNGYFDADRGSDNQIGSDPNIYLNGQGIQSVTDNVWDNVYQDIRKLNIMFSNTDAVAWEDINVYVSEGRFFRAWYYFQILKRFGGVPWINKEIDINDTEALTTPRVSRDVLADSIVADLDFAIAYLPEKADADKFRISKEAALAFKTRVCLYEGTWEKYHGEKGTPFKVDGSDGTKYLQMAMDAALQVINPNNFSIDKNGDEPYMSLFNSEDFSSSSEMILWRQKIRGLGGQNVAMTMLYGVSSGLTSDLINTYLCTDGLPVSLSPLDVSDYSLEDVVINRDPRMAQTIFYPGVPKTINDETGKVVKFLIPVLTKVKTGYMQRKGYSPSSSNLADDQVAYIHFRYGEVLLNYIEAKAELAESGNVTLSQNDFDISINKLRDRVGMPPFNYSEQIVDPDDPMTGVLPWYLVEIRRERRIELAVEGYRIDDIFRWAAADMLIRDRVFHGAPFQYYLDEAWYTSDQIAFVDNDGYLSPWYNTAIDLQGGYAFNLGRDYLYSIPLQEITLADYSNNPGW